MEVEELAGEAIKKGSSPDSLHKGGDGIRRRDTYIYIDPGFNSREVSDEKRPGSHQDICCEREQLGDAVAVGQGGGWLPARRDSA